MKEINITEKTSGGRLDKLLLRYLKAAPKGFIYKMLRKKNIVLNDKKASGNEILKSGDCIRLYLADETIEKFKGQNAGQGDESGSFGLAGRLKQLIIYEDENIIALNKPSGLLTQKAKPGDISLNDMLAAYLGKDDFFSPGAANRLDRNTAGIVLASKNPAAARLLSEAVKDRLFKKKYLALVCGSFSERKILEGYIIKDERENKSLIIRGKEGGTPNGAKYIKAAYEPLSSNGRYTLLEAELMTGRSHQIRAQLADAGNPLAGDYKYGDKISNEKLKRKYALKSQFLCAWRIDFENMPQGLHYLDGKSIKAQLPGNFIEILKGENLWLPGLQED